VNRLGRALRDPLVTFLLVGACLFVVYRVLNGAEVEPVVLGEAAHNVLLAEFVALTGRSPTEAERREIFDDFYRREVLYREALRAGLQHSDAALREAMIERMQRRVSGELLEPPAEDLVNYYADHIERYYSESTISFEQRFFRNAPADKAMLLEALESGTGPVSDTAWQGSVFPDYGLSMIRGLFGQPLLDELSSLPMNRWHGPLKSVDGWHCFRISARREAQLLPYEQVRDQVLGDYQAAILETRTTVFIESLGRRYPFEVAPAAP
jgi:hypothetical protein